MRSEPLGATRSHSEPRGTGHRQARSNPKRRDLRQEIEGQEIEAKEPRDRRQKIRAKKMPNRSTAPQGPALGPGPWGAWFWAFSADVRWLLGRRLFVRLFFVRPFFVRPCATGDRARLATVRDCANQATVRHRVTSVLGKSALGKSALGKWALGKWALGKSALRKVSRRAETRRGFHPV